MSDLDDWQTMFIDLDRDGVFNDLGQYDGNPADQSLGGSRGEQLSWNDGGTKVVNLGAGDYLVAMTHLEGGGGSRIEYQFRSPSMGGQVVVNPASPTQAGLWNALVAVAPDNNVIKTGTGTVTLSGDNTYDGQTRIQAGTLVAGHDRALGLDHRRHGRPAGGHLGPARRTHDHRRTIDAGRHRGDRPLRGAVEPGRHQLLQRPDLGRRDAAAPSPSARWRVRSTSRRTSTCRSRG